MHMVTCCAVVALHPLLSKNILTDFLNTDCIGSEAAEVLMRCCSSIDGGGIDVRGHVYSPSVSMPKALQHGRTLRLSAA